MPHAQPPRRRPALGLSPAVILLLALLAAPRVVLHDLDLVQEGSAVNGLLVFVPPLVWIAVAVGKRVPNPFVTLLVVGLVHGVLLALGHQVLWESAFGDDPPSLGGNLSDLDPAVETVIIRFFAVVSGVFTGVLVGAVTGLAATGIARLTGRS
ncbi:DUF4235 domain-containing protein [Streptomyces marincola]|uniref:Uncharacterized protein n=1 Tax=Streptomyces marincola TaxID=2878388 RepID=A0A1W7D699_9ACTN|nr:DUF4235 domain-containing protein [Streptomyces marincola]ARQ72505.1 hypothetical protein CAG99_19935 [Streptomyces marincola]